MQIKSIKLFLNEFEMAGREGGGDKAVRMCPCGGTTGLVDGEFWCQKVCFWHQEILIGDWRYDPWCLAKLVSVCVCAINS